MKPNRRRETPTKAWQDTLILSRTEDRATLASDPSADPEAGMGGSRSWSAYRIHPGNKAINAKRVAPPPDSLRPVCARPRRSSPFSHLFALWGAWASSSRVSQSQRQLSKA